MPGELLEPSRVKDTSDVNKERRLRFRKKTLTDESGEMKTEI